MQLNNRSQGIAMIAALALLVVASGIMTMMLTRSVGEMKHSRDDAAIVQTLMLARGGANMASALLQGTVRDRLQTIVERESNTSSPWSFGSGNSERPSAASVINALTNDKNRNSVANQLQAEIDSLLCQQTISPTGANATIALRIFVTEQSCGETLPAGINLPEGRFVRGQARGAGPNDGQTYAIPFVMVSQATSNDYRRSVVLQGEYQFTVGRTSFARYALFTNVHETSNGGSIWFTDNTLFDGPVHTNQFYRFYRKPWFGGEVTSAGCNRPLADSCQGNLFTRRGAEFYGNGFVRAENMQPPTNPSYSNRYGTHEPELTSGVDWGADFVPLPQNALDQKAAAQDKGLYFNNSLYSLTLSAVDDNYQPVTGGDRAKYQLIEACTSRRNCTTYRLDDDGKLEELRGNNWRKITDDFNGAIYVEGGVSRLRGPDRNPWYSTDPADAPPAVASFAQMTVVATGDVRITGDLTYEDPPCSGSPQRDARGNVTPAVCNNLSAQNVLGIYTPTSDVLIGNNNRSSSLNAPDNVTVHGVLMSAKGVVTVEDYDRGFPRGEVNLLGGIIEYNYGAFGTFSASTGSRRSGYGRSFTYDRRMAAGFAPPFFPTVGLDGVKSVLTISFGQREQVY